MLEQEAALLTQVLARGARNDPFLVLVTLGRAKTEKSSAGTDFYQPLGMAQCLGSDGAGLAGTPVLLEEPQGFVPGRFCCKSRGLGERPGLQERAAWCGVRMHRLRLLSRAAIPAVNQGTPGRGGRHRDRDSGSDLWPGWSWKHPRAGEAAALQLLSDGTAASELELELQTFTASFPFYFFSAVDGN